MELLNFTVQPRQIVDTLNMSLSAAYLPGRYNGISDRLSKKKPLPEWHLLPQATYEIFRKWGVSEIDLLASAKTVVVSRYVSRNYNDPYAYFIGEFIRPWNFSLAWVVPPPNLIPRVLQMLGSVSDN